jgi:hypothetical protein
METRRQFLALVGISLLTMGCGGGAVPLDGLATGQATLLIQWPSRSRLIPLEAKSIRVEIKTQAGAQVALKILDRPATGNTTTTTFIDLPEGLLTVQATAFPQSNAQGTAQADGTATITIVRAQTSTLTLTMATTITRLELSPAQLTQNETVFVTATPRDSADRLVLTPPGSIQLTLEEGTSDALWDASSGKLTPLKQITIRIRAVETESGVASTQSWTVGALSVGLKTFLQRNRDMAYDRLRHRIWLSVPSNGSTQPHSVVAIHPETGQVTQSYPLPFEPDQLSLSSDGSILHVGQYKQLDRYRVWGVELATGQVLNPSLANSEPPNSWIVGFNALPGSPKSLVYINVYDIAVFDNDTSRPRKENNPSGFSNPALMNPDGKVIYNLRSLDLKRYAISADGVTETHKVTLSQDEEFFPFDVSSSVLVGNSLTLRDPANLQVLRKLPEPLTGKLLTPTQILAHILDSTLDRNYLLIYTRQPSATYHIEPPLVIASYQTSTGSLIGVYTLPKPSTGGEFWASPLTNNYYRYFVRSRFSLIAPGRLIFRTDDNRIFHIQMPLPAGGVGQGSLQGDIK